MVMPDHVHLVFELLRGRISGVMNRFKGFTGREINQLLKMPGPIWSRQYYEHFIRSDESYRNIVEYCYANPVRRGLVEDAKRWPFWWCAWELE